MANRINTVEEFLAGKWKLLPPWARVTSYFIILLTYIYFLMTPQFIYGECYIKDSDGGLSAFRNNFVHVNIDGHTIKQKINEDGVWVIPLVSKIPKKVTLHFWYNNRSYPVDVDAGSVLTGKNIKVYVEENPIRFYTAVPARERTAAASVGHFLMTPLLNLFAGITAAGPDDNPEHPDSLEAIIKTIVAQTHKVDTSRIVPASAVKRNPNPSAIENIKLQYRFEKTFNIRIPDEAWDTLNTVSSLRKFVEQQRTEKIRKK